MNFSGPLFLLVFPLLMSVAVPLAVLGLLGWLYKKKQKTLPQNAARGSRASRLTEMIAIGGISLSMLTLLMRFRSYDEVPYALSELAPASVRQQYFLVWGSILICILIAMIFAWFHRGFIACIGLTVTFCGFGYLVNSGEVLSYKHHEDEIRKMPLALHIKLQDDIVGADVWFNGMHIGKTPIKADLDEVLAKIPNWDDKTPEERREIRENGSRQLMSFAVLTPSSVEAYWSKEKRKVVFYRAELDGKQLSDIRNTVLMGGSRMFGQLQPCHITLGMILPEWRSEIDLLLMQARLSDYQVDENWLEAMQSYGKFGWKLLRSQSQKEPEFNQVLDAWAADVYGIDSNIDPTTARNKFDQICDEANRRSEYFTDSPAGRAVELLLPNLDREEMVDRAVNRICSMRITSSGERRWNSRSENRFDFGVTFNNSPTKSMLHPADYVLAHVIWKLDAIYDAEDDSSDNPIEERIVASIMQKRSRRGHLGICQALGGTIFERFILRHNVRILPDQMKGNEFVTGRITIGSVAWNRWLYIAATIDSPAGKRFRISHRNLILAYASTVIKSSNHINYFEDVERMGFLFLDPELKNDSLAAIFWPTYTHHTKFDEGAGRVIIGNRWKYLARMQPYVTVKAFVESYSPIEKTNYTTKTALTKLEPEFQLEVLTALVAKSNEMLSHSKTRSHSFNIYRMDRDEFAEMARRVPCEKSAELMMQWLSETAEDHAKRVSRTKSLANSNQLPDQHLIALANSNDAILRVLVLPAIEKFPTPNRRVILKQLLSDSEPSVKKEASAIQARLDAIRNKTYPMRK